MFSRLSAIAVFFILSAAAAPLTRAAAAPNDVAERFVAAHPSQPVPLFQFQDGKGVERDLKDYKGRYILLNLWATWCGPCVKEMPTLNELETKMGDRVTFIALNEDRNGAAAAESFYTRHNLTNLPVYVDASGRAPSLLHISGLPVTLLIDPAGNEIGRIEGEADWAAPDTIAFLKTRMKL